MNTPQYLMTKQDKQYVRLGEQAFFALITD